MNPFDILANLAEALWGCSHKRTSFPITIAEDAETNTYVVCTECGRRFPYDWKSMSKTGRPQ